MTFIHEHPDWPRLTWDTAPLADPLAEVRHKQGRLLGRMESLGFDLTSEASLAVLAADVVKTSAIEGEVLNPDEVRSSIARHLGLDAAGLPTPGRNVDGIVEMMLDATRNFALPITRQRLFDWHTSLFPARGGVRPISAGAWRTDATGPMQVVSGPLGYQRVHFEAPAASRLDAEMDRFLTWFNAPDEQDPVLRAAVAHFWFVTIHPFEDGNGRIARAIADLSLARADRTEQRYYSMSTQIEAERRDYYLVLEAAQRGTPDITRWLKWFLACLGRAIDNADQIVAAVLRKAHAWQIINRHPTNERQRLILDRMLNGFRGHMTTSKYATLASCSSDTALRDIRELVERGILAQNAPRGRSTSYRLADPLA